MEASAGIRGALESSSSPARRGVWAPGRGGRGAKGRRPRRVVGWEAHCRDGNTELPGGVSGTSGARKTCLPRPRGPSQNSPREAPPGARNPPPPPREPAAQKPRPACAGAGLGEAWGAARSRDLPTRTGGLGLAHLVWPPWVCWLNVSCAREHVRVEPGDLGGARVGGDFARREPRARAPQLASCRPRVCRAPVTREVPATGSARPPQQDWGAGGSARLPFS